MKHYEKIFPNVSAHFDHNDATVTKMVGNLFESSRKNLLTGDVDGDRRAVLLDVPAQGEGGQVLLLGGADLDHAVKRLRGEGGGRWDPLLRQHLQAS